MLYSSFFPRDLFAEVDRLQRELQQAFGLSPTIRGLARGGFPALNMGSTPQSVEVYAFVPGIDPSTIDVQVAKGVLTLSGVRNDDLPNDEQQVTLHTNERFDGRFRRVVSLPEDIDPDAVQASCHDGLLHISIQRRAEAQPRRITIQ